ncbi:hypothetical protein C8R46DRAFT_1208131 [Mycena filopes]|nr:hypothetical protein C8R46DRAFT_1208131 [Mycena filopes]
MAFLNGGPYSTGIYGGTFNNVAGNLNVVGDYNVTYNTVTSGPVQANRNQQMLGSGVHRTERHARPISGPYDIPESRRLARNQQSAENTGLSSIPSDLRILPHVLGPTIEWTSGAADSAGSPTAPSPPHPLGTSHPNPSFTSVRGNVTSVNVMSYGENGLDVLYRSVVRGAIHNSAERPPDPACYPGTRHTVLDDLDTWSHDTHSPATVLWLHGSAGMGKSAIAQDFAARCQKEGVLGASFFFKRGSPDRGTWKGLFPTLAYQLAASFSKLKGPIQQAVEEDKLVVAQAMRHQMQKLLIAPFHEAASLTKQPIIVIDGLDECEDHSTQVPLLKLILDAVRTGSLPARFLVVSRPEAHIREITQAAENFGICRHLELHPDSSALADVRRYLSEEFSRIRQSERLQSLRLEDDWPGQAGINHLVKKSSGTFLYVATVVRYIDDQYSDPTEQLARVLDLDPQSTAPLDTLYAEVLSRVPDRVTLQRILHAVIHLGQELKAEDIDCALHIRSGTTRLTLRSLHSLLLVPPPQSHYSVVKVLHASFQDFLIDPTRSRDLCIAQSSLNFDLVSSMTTFLSTSPTDSFNWRRIVRTLVDYIVTLDPRDDMLPILYDLEVQQVLFESSSKVVYEIIAWLECCSPPPIDLIHVWEDLSFVYELVSGDSYNLRGPTLPIGTRCDGIFTDILSHQPQTLSAVQTLSTLSGWVDRPWPDVLDLLSIKWNFD